MAPTRLERVAEELEEPRARQGVVALQEPRAPQDAAVPAVAEPAALQARVVAEPAVAAAAVRQAPRERQAPRAMSPMRVRTQPYRMLAETAA